MRRSLRLALSFTVVVALIAPAAAFAAKSTNDLYRSATVIGSLPFSETLSTTTATIESGEPSPCFSQPNNSVWYAYKPPSDQVIRVSTIGSSYDAFPQIYVVGRHGLSGLTPLLPCGTRQLQVTGGTTYAIQVTDENPAGGGGTLVFSIEQAIPPANDDFASAMPVTSLPFTDRIDLAGATVESGEPTAARCTAFPPLIASAWYAFSPTADGQLQVLLNGGFESVAAVYTGSSIDTLTELDCGSGAIAVQAGTTYYVQVAAESLGKGVIDVTLRQPPPPQAGFAFTPAEPNSIDPVEFFDQTFDPGFADWNDAWSFGDGSTSSLFNPTHRYATDGDYVVGLSVTTLDGRTGSTEQTISVRTHDVGIVGISAPNSARSGQTRSVVVSVVDRRYPETVEVRLYRVDDAGQTLIGDTFLDLAVSEKATTVSFPYTFTAADATAGRVTFLATVDIAGHTDALPADNSRTAVTAVTR
jgi:PKD repeat protein